MSAGYALPLAWAQAKPILEQALQQLQASSPTGPAQAPYPPRNLLAQSGSLVVTFSWNPPVLNGNVTGYRVYKGDENHLFQAIDDPNTTSCAVPIPANSHVGLYVSCVNSVGQESNKIFILGKSNTDQHVTAGTSGGTNGTVPLPPPISPGRPKYLP